MINSIYTGGFNLELHQLIQFKTIAECPTMTLAAERLHISQPALSIMLKKFEDELGVRLFDRKKNKISLNETGELALTHTNEILKKIDEMKLSLSDYAHRDHIFKVGFCDPGPLWYCTPGFSMMYPDYEMKSSIYSSTSDETELLLNQYYDVLITDKEISHPDIICNPFIEDQLLLSISEKNPIAKNESISLRNLEHLSIAMFYVGGSFYAKQEIFYQELSPNISLDLFEDYFLFQQKVHNTNVSTFTTELVRHYRDDGPNRKLIQITDPEVSIQYNIAYLKKNTARLKVLLDWTETQKSKYIR